MSSTQLLAVVAVFHILIATSCPRHIWPHVPGRLWRAQLFSPVSLHHYLCEPRLHYHLLFSLDPGVPLPWAFGQLHSPPFFPRPSRATPPLNMRAGARFPLHL